MAHGICLIIRIWYYWLMKCCAFERFHSPNPPPAAAALHHLHRLRPASPAAMATLAGGGVGDRVKRLTNAVKQPSWCLDLSTDPVEFVKNRREKMSQIVGQAWNKYLELLDTHPIRTKSITAGALVGCSDAIAQQISGIRKLQLRRLLLVMLYGVAYGGVVGHYMHKILDKIFKGKTDKTTVVKQVLLEQLTTSPLDNLLFMTYYGLVVEKRARRSVKSSIRTEWPRVQLTSWKFWPVAAWLNFQYMPVQFRVLFHCIVDCRWGIFLTLKAHSAGAAIKAA